MPQAEITSTVELSAHSALIENLLRELQPRTVAAVATDPLLLSWLEQRAAALDFERVTDPGAADLLISGVTDYLSLRELLVGFGKRVRAAVVGGTGWPCARRDARSDLVGVDEEERRRYAYRMPVAGRTGLGTEPSSIAFAMHEGGPENGVLTALEDAREQAAEPWEMRLVPGFGGVAVVLAAELATPERWLAILPDEILERTLGRLELANAQLRLDRERLLEELDEAAAVSGASTVLSDLSQLAERLAAVDRSEAHDRARVERLIDAAIDDSERRVDRERRRTRAAERGLAAEQAARAAVEVELEHARTTIDELDHRTREMEGTAADLADELARARTENEELISAHADELAFVAEQVRLAAGSQAWRWGHRAARAGRRLTFRRSRGTDSLTKVLNRIAPQDDVEPTPPAD